MLPSLFLRTFLFFSSLLCSSAKEAITLHTSIRDGEGESLISPGKRFELGFFTPNGSFNTRRYVGIWYYGSNPQTVVWVANRDKPLLDDSGVLVVAEDGNLKLLDGSGESFWSTNLEAVSSVYRKAKLKDAGNLVLSKEEEEENHSSSVIWQSFDNPTDTFLPGMRMDGDVILTSWKSYDDPASGNFTFQTDQERVNQFIIWKRTTRYWKSGVSGRFIGPDGMPSTMPSAISFFLSNFTSVVLHNESMPHLTSSLYSDTRLVISFSGQIQYFKWDSERIWSLIWAEPRDKCSVYNACGNFGSCNSNNDLICKCLPGFFPSSSTNWNSQDYFDGCTRKSRICDKNAKSDTFLNLNMMEVGNPDSQFNAKNEMECKLECLNNCQCQAYSYEEPDIVQQGGSSSIAACWIWLEDLNNIQEEYEGGRNLKVRLAVSDVGSNRRNCETCGTNLIPYPLSTAPKCGDAMYLSFHCNFSSGEVNFDAPGGTYRVTSINPDTRKFSIQTNDANDCKAENSGDSFLQLKRPSPFRVTSRCNADEVEIGWDPPPEPTCSSPSDCKDWPNTSCNVTSDGKKRCLCIENFRWDNLSLNCTEDRGYGEKRYKSSTRKMALSLILVIVFLSAVVLFILSSTIVYVYLQRKKLAEGEGILGNLQRNSACHLYDGERHVKGLIDSGRFKEDDTDGIEVPFFQLESILAATRNFSNANKLGQGGFGPVYKGEFPGGQEIAVKRLSSCSGQGLEEFKNEVVLIARLQHRNLVRLLGYCVAGDEKMLLYEYMPNRSLDSFIFDRKLCTLLDWDMRYRIILGIARGLLYLHQDSRLRIIHRDLKTSNILLDEEMNPKISDFGLARIFGGKETAANTNRVVGTYGYMSPEYALDGLFSFKSDVFSFGVVVIEIMSGKRNTGFYQPEQSLSLLGYAWHLWKADKAIDLLDQVLRESCNANELLKCLNVGLLCVQEDPSERPTMSQVVFMLGSEIASLPGPKQPAFVVRRCPSSKASSSSKPETFSQNELTVTLECGR